MPNNKDIMKEAFKEALTEFLDEHYKCIGRKFVYSFFVLVAMGVLMLSYKLGFLSKVL